ncbi:unnamed protein product [Parascedosporium putredinis]|uniref:Nudix hydrolase domain-containing protein n=1 Tax=Parascedosporium putredinis TaxID=1442378 RepID=A0A9P1H832_9PEZI|nr:unnamed protein product [Parascedosporium putredinis]CAI8001822.1 unnamed protein product [Parascedosporium putredinis]
MSKAQAKKPVPEPSPSSRKQRHPRLPTNQILLLHRVRTSTSFASAHVFPGGNLDDLHDGAVASPQDPAARHADGPAYRLAAVRECFEESGILLARGPHGRLVDVDPAVRDEGRRKVHRGEVKFGDWLKSVGATADVAPRPPRLHLPHPRHLLPAFLLFSVAPAHHPTAAIPWAEKIISPKVLKVRDDGYVVLGLHSPGAEVEAIQDNASGSPATPRGGLHDAAVVVNLKVKGGPWNLGVFSRQDALRSDDLGVAGASAKGGKL